MWFWLIQAITGSILGNATSAWFEKTKVGKWFYKKTEQVYNWAANRYGFEVLRLQLLCSTQLLFERWEGVVPRTYGIGQALEGESRQL